MVSAFEERRAKMKRILLTLLVISLLGAACGGGNGTPTEEGKAGSGHTLPAATQAVIKPTSTPVPPPPTPTPLPTNTPVPTKEVTSEEEVEAPTPAPQITDVMNEIPAGPFVMGSDAGAPDEGPKREVDVSAFSIDRFEVTNKDFAAFVEATGYVTDGEESGAKRIWRDEYGDGEENHPVVRVNWNDAVAYCEWLGKRLPSEAEWEKSARGPDNTKYPWGDEYDAAQANGKDSGLRGTASVGSYPANGYGLHDMAGNVWEWTADWYQPYPGNIIEDEFYGERFRVVRGGGWFEEAATLATYNRNAADPVKTANDDLGFRCAK
jgi:formylglycine-generating enzyme required for sulfatase activity